MEANDLNKPTEESTGLNSEQNSETTSQENQTAEAVNEATDAEAKVEEVSSGEAKSEELVTEAAPKEVKEPELEKVDHNSLSNEQLVKRLQEVLSNHPIEKIRDEVEAIKATFYKKHLAEVDALKRKFIESGELEENFAPPVNVLEAELKKLLFEYKDRKSAYNKRAEDEKESNYKAKLAVIDGIKDLLNRQESLNSTFNEFRDLQQKWREIGPVAQSRVHGLWETYNIHIENFYGYIKINKELRDLDLKKNLELKIELCEKAEKLLLEPTIIKAFKTLQKYHEQWREIGPAPHDKKEEVWTRFKEATSLINKRHQEYFEGLKAQLQKNLEAKSELCEKGEALAALELGSPKEWEAKSKELIELQTVWKTIGFAPKKDNNLIYERFRSACDKFFNNKRDFFKTYKNDQHNNLQLKTELCIQAEGLKENKDWRRTTDEFIKIQKKWKEIGPVPRKQSDVIWKRFRSACDFFFEQKAAFFSQADEKQGENLVSKKALIEEVKTFVLSEDSEDNFKKLQGFQHRWNEIGHVPIKEKENVNQEFRNLINSHFDNLNMDDFQKNVQKFRNKVENYKTGDYSPDKLVQERNKIINKLKQLENDITLWENNIGFFAKSKKSEALVRDFTHKIETGRRNIKLLNKKLDMLDASMK